MFRLRSPGEAQKAWIVSVFRMHGGMLMADARIPLSKLLPKGENIDGAALLDEITARFARHLILPTGAAEMIALWVLYSHTMKSGVYTHNPRLLFRSPTWNCGKTTAMTLVNELMLCPLMASSISGASLYRAADQHDCSLLLDEADTQFQNDPAVFGILNAGHTRAGSLVVRQDGDSKGGGTTPSSFRRGRHWSSVGTSIDERCRWCSRAGVSMS
jgi:hypothetical protein